MAKSANGEGSVYMDKTTNRAVHKYFDATGMHRNYYKTMKEAHKAKRDYLHQRDNGILAGKDINLVSFLNQWLENLDVAPRTQEDYEATVRNYIIPHLGKKISIRELQVKHITDMLNRLKNQKKRGTDKLLMPRTINHVRSVLRNALNDAMRQDLVGRNVASLAKPFKVKKHQFDFIAAAEVDQFDNAVSAHRLNAMYMLGIRTGMRASELVGLRWSDIDFENRQINLMNQVQRINKVWQLSPLKRDDDEVGRIIPMTEDVMFILKRHQVWQDSEIEVLGVDNWASQLKGIKSFSGDTQLVFTRADGNPVYSKNALSDLDKLTEAAGLKRVTLHDLRRSLISNMAASGIAQTTTANLVGHSTTRLTDDVYTGVNTDSKREALEIFTKRIKDVS
tara:strand:+ start:413 stop:1591 length:1179 start_codon:yes stop_codon:yes gene_type:complete